MLGVEHDEAISINFKVLRVLTHDVRSVRLY
jgi:hypothetical protein